MSEVLKFSVLISVYAEENAIYFRESLDSIFAQSLLPNEVVIVKDGPLNPDLENVIIEFQGQFPELIKTLALPVNKGLSYALNQGLEFATYNLIARMDSDDICHPLRFEKQVREFELDSNLDILGTALYEFASDIVHCEDIRTVPVNSVDIKKFAKQRSPMNHPTVMYKRDLILKLGGYSHFSKFEDYPLWVKAIMSGAVLRNLEEPLLFFRANDLMYRRRGGLTYALVEFKMFKQFYAIGFINIFQFLRTTSIRFVVRMIPFPLRKAFYHYVLRHSVKKQ